MNNQDRQTDQTHKSIIDKEALSPFMLIPVGILVVLCVTTAIFTTVKQGLELFIIIGGSMLIGLWMQMNWYATLEKVHDNTTVKELGKLTGQFISKSILPAIVVVILFVIYKAVAR